MPPAIVREGQDHIIFRANVRIDIPCTAIGVPKPEYVYEFPIPEYIYMSTKPEYVYELPNLSIYTSCQT